MRLKKYLLISLGLHILAGAVYALSLYAKLNYIDVNAVEIQSLPRPKNPESPFQFMDEADRSKKKPVIETNKQPQMAREDAGIETGDSGSTNYVPSYMADEIPSAITPIDPVYPEEARRQEIEGRIILMVYIDANGNVRNVEIIKSPNPMLSESAKKAVLAAKFRPARIGGNFKPVRMQLTIKFHLE